MRLPAGARRALTRIRALRDAAGPRANPAPHEPLDRHGAAPGGGAAAGRGTAEPDWRRHLPTTLTTAEAVTALALDNAHLRARLGTDPWQGPAVEEPTDEQRALAEEYLTGQQAAAPSAQAAETGNGTAPRHLVIVHNYPRPGAEYGNGFVHRRVKLYQQAGVAVDVVVAGPNAAPRIYEYDGVRVLSGSGPVLRGLLSAVEAGAGLRGTYTSASTHFLNDYLWAAVGEHRAELDWYVYVHGFEARHWVRTLCNVGLDDPKLPAHVAATVRRQRFWRHVLDAADGPAGYVFVSDWWRRACQEDMHVVFPADRSTVITNVIDDAVFHPGTGAESRSADDRFRLVWVRSASRPNYAADLAARTLETLRSSPHWDRLRITAIGEGAHMREFTDRFAGDPNVRIEERFASQGEVAELYRTHGIALVPSRLDTQGVSRDEAMACACVPVTNAVAAIPEFVDGTESVLAPAEDVQAMADGIAALLDDPAEYLRRSRRAVANVRGRSLPDRTVERELALMGLRRST
ncbi:glycosyltransferase family 4 protein [Zhihengliuella sp.]|uniref:glycosyltransferase family 4 protein n=1 Tax=Zhihengliuella sp. TaxID=1954483 RepID=UPI0028125614|nr:glycosyltransferase family 4 protein [Zhihengliuella sp.]